MLNELCVDHPYYCSDSNYYSREASVNWETMTDFLDEYEDADIDMNFVFRWDIRNRSEDEEGVKAGRYYAEVFMIHQRKGIFSPHYINHVNDAEAKRFRAYAERHWLNMQLLWAPIAQPSESSK